MSGVVNVQAVDVGRTRARVARCRPGCVVQADTGGRGRVPPCRRTSGGPPDERMRAGWVGARGGWVREAGGCKRWVGVGEEWADGI